MFGAGSAGASVTKFIGPVLIAGTAGTVYLGFVDGGWRLVPVIYAALLLAVAALLWALTPRRDRGPGRGRPLPDEVGSVGGLVGMLGGLGGFILPSLLAYATGRTGLPSTATVR